MGRDVAFSNKETPFFHRQSFEIAPISKNELTNKSTLNLVLKNQCSYEFEVVFAKMKESTKHI